MNGYCDICNERAINGLGYEEYCERHFQIKTKAVKKRSYLTIMRIIRRKEGIAKIAKK